MVVLYWEAIDTGMNSVLAVFTALMTILPLVKELLAGNVDIADDRNSPIFVIINEFEPARLFFPIERKAIHMTDCSTR